MKPFIQEDIRKLSEELIETQTLLNQMDENKKNSMIAIRDVDEIKERLLSFAKYAEGEQLEVLMTLIQSVIEKIYIVDKACERICHIFIKGCSGEDYTSFFQATSYIETGAIPVETDMCDSKEHRICT